MAACYELTAQPVRPLRLLLLALVTTFVAEYGIMKFLPRFLPKESSQTFEAVADAFLLTVFVAPVLWVVAVRPIQRLARSRMYFLRRALTSQEEERRRITLDLHDGLGQSLTSLMLGLRAMEETTADLKVREQVDELRRMGGGIHEELRRIVRGLRPAILDQLGLSAAIERLVEEVRQTVSATVEFTSTGLTGLRFNAELESTAFRIVQEALSNAIRHSSANRVGVTAFIQGGQLGLRIEDNGKGFHASSVFRGDNGGSYGLLSIRERAMISGGRAEIRTSPGAGTVVLAYLPLTIQNEHNV